MTVAQFEAEGIDVESQALTCFARLRDFVQGFGERIDSASYLIVEVSRRDSLATVMRARRTVFGDRRPATVSSRLARLPAGELIRVTVEIDTSHPERDPEDSGLLRRQHDTTEVSDPDTSDTGTAGGHP